MVFTGAPPMYTVNVWADMSPSAVTPAFVWNSVCRRPTDTEMDAEVGRYPADVHVRCRSSTQLNCPASVVPARMLTARSTRALSVTGSANRTSTGAAIPTTWPGPGEIACTAGKSDVTNAAPAPPDPNAAAAAATVAMMKIFIAFRMVPSLRKGVVLDPQTMT
ncbi:hypothetical protein Ntsu_45140 [Nocardia sp. IFM 10818]